MPAADKSTPRPWRPHPEYAGCLIGPPPHGHMIVDCTDSRYSEEEAAANAAFILRAANQFAPLVGTLKGLIEAMEAVVSVYGVTELSRARLSDARHAVQLAELP